MAYGLKYRLDWKDVDNYSNSVLIYQDEYTGTVTDLIATDQPCTHKYERSDNEDLVDPIMSSTLTISFYSTDTVDFRAFYSESDRDFKVIYQFEGVTKFTGYLLNDITGEPFQDPPYPVVLTATDGLAQLKELTIENNENDLDLGGFLFDKLNTLDLELDFEICNDLYEGLEQDSDRSIFDQEEGKRLLIQAGTFGEIEFNVYEYIETVCKSFGWVLFQANNRWVFQRPIARAKDLTVIYVHDWQSYEVIDSFTNSIAVSPNNWVLRPITSRAYKTVIFALNKFYAVSPGSVITVSNDGLSWSTISIGSFNLEDIIYADGKFVGVGGQIEGTTFITNIEVSTDGINWTRYTPNFNIIFKSVAFGKGLFVAVANLGAGNRLATSPDGINWTQRSIPENNNWEAITFGNGRFVAISSSGTNRTMYSDDGINWTSVNRNTGSKAIIFANNLFTAGRQYSPDGLTWFSVSQLSTIVVEAITYGGGYYVLVGSFLTQKIAYSTDAISWTVIDAPEDSGWNAIAFGNFKYVSLAFSGTNRLMTSFLELTDEKVAKKTVLDANWSPINADQIVQFQRPIKKLTVTQNDLGQDLIENGDNFTEFSWSLDLFYELNDWTLINDPVIPIQVVPENIPLQSTYDIERGVSWDIKFIPNGANTDKPIISKPVFLDFAGLTLDFEMDVEFITASSGISVAIKHEDVNDNVKYLTVSNVAGFQVLVWDEDFKEFVFNANSDNEKRTLKISSFVLPTVGFYSVEIKYKGTTGNTVVRSVKTIPIYEGKRNPSDLKKIYETARRYTFIREEDLKISDVVITNSKNWLKIGKFPAIVFVENSLKNIPGIIKTPTNVLTQVDRLTDTVTSNTVNLNAGLWNGQINIQYVADTGFTISNMLVRIIPTIFSTPSFRITTTTTVISSQQRNLKIELNDFPENDRFTVQVDINLQDVDGNAYQTSIFAFTNIETSTTVAGWNYFQTNISFENQALLGNYEPTLRDTYARNMLTIYNVLSFRIEGSFRRVDNNWAYPNIITNFDFSGYQNASFIPIGWEYDCASRIARITFGQVPTSYVYPLN